MFFFFLFPQNPEKTVKIFALVFYLFLVSNFIGVKWEERDSCPENKRVLRPAAKAADADAVCPGNDAPTSWGSASSPR